VRRHRTPLTRAVLTAWLHSAPNSARPWARRALAQHYSRLCLIHGPQPGRRAVHASAVPSPPTGPRVASPFLAAPSAAGVSPLIVAPATME
jgi:hypothetical protein